ncbi:hypothetical protein EV182_007575 [Spiromyces aspiralis]|uniref:Uncharacterized protein n=1 Tax=Spiromyces aspiralis TaxID=68401 RepID=A0ACC1HS37_9FUNG|nr:hypothetical protein EV182_007575 [Spiromyces aspiralis]
MVTTKALPNLVDMPEIIAPAVKDGHTAIVLIQNGIGIEAPYEHRFPNNPIISVVSYLDARHDNRNRDLIIHGTTVAIALNLYHGYSDNHPSSTAGSSSMAAAVGQQALDTLVEAFNRGKVECVIVKSIQACRWQKLIWNGAFNPMSVLAGGRNTAEMLACPQFYQLVLDVMNEIYTAGCTVTGQSLDGGYYGGGPNIILKRTMDAPVPVYPSMLGDFKSGRPMEHQVILKNTIDIAKRHGVEMPRLETIYGHLLLLESSYLKNNERTSPS